MKKNFLLLFLLVLFTNFSSAQFVRIWEKSDALNNLPAWFSSTGTRERGIAYCAFDGIPKLYVISNLSEPTVIILNALTGDSLGVLNTQGITGGILYLSDISSYPVDFVSYPFIPALYACNITDNASTSHYKIYKWESDTNAPQLLVEDSLPTFRIGDCLNIGIDLFPFQRFHLINASSNNNKVVDYYSYTGDPPFIREEITLSDGNMGSNASADYNWIYPFFDQGSYIVNSNGFSPKFYDTLGVFQLISDTSIVSSSSNSIKYYANGTLCCDLPFYTTYNYAENNASLVLSQGPPWETLWGETPSLGDNPNPEHYGDVEYCWLSYDFLLIFVLAGNNGLGAYFAPGLSLPVELISFTAESINDEVVLKWQTATETNNSGFEILRLAQNDKSEWQSIGFVEGRGTTTERYDYIFRDEISKPGIYSYRLKQIDFDGSISYSNEVEVDVLGPKEFALYQNYPNPFNPSTTIKFALPIDSKVKINVYNSLGQLVETLVDQEMESGYHELNFDASKLTSGVYLYQLQAGENVSVKKMILMK
jgi:hypothetical protein